MKTIFVVLLAFCISMMYAVNTNHVTMDLSEFKTLFQKVNEPHACPKPPVEKADGPSPFKSGNFVMLDIDVNGTVNLVEKLALFTHTFLIQVFESRWASIPLFSSDTIVSDIIVKYTNGTLVDKNVAFVAMSDQNFMLYIKEAGRYVVETVVHRRLAISKNLYETTLNERHLINSFYMEFHGSTVRDFHIHPLSSMQIREVSPTLTTVRAFVQPTPEIIMTWRPNSSATDARVTPEPERMPQITCMQESLHSLGDMTVQSTSFFTYELNHDVDVIDKLKINVRGKNVRVVRVTGAYIESWRTEDPDKNVTKNSRDSSPNSPIPDKVLIIQLKNSIPNDKYQIILSTEQDVGEQEQLVLPTFECVGVLRQQGRMGIVKAANVEVHELESRGVGKADSSELSEMIRSQTAKTILLTYHFLHHDYFIRLKKTRHTSMDLLDASIEHAHLETTFADEYSIHKYTFSFTNTNRQYLTVFLPKNLVAIWSTYVNSEPVKPVIDKDGNMLIPLASTIGAIDGRTKLSMNSIELVYLTRHAVLNVTGKVELEVPSVNIPINLLTSGISFPEKYQLDFSTSGGMRRVTYLSKSVPVPVSALKGRKVTKNGHDFLNQYVLEDDMGGEGSMKNVYVNIPTVGDHYYFEKLLVLEQAQTIGINYKEFTLQSETIFTRILRHLGVPNVTTVSDFINQHHSQLIGLSVALVIILLTFVYFIVKKTINCIADCIQYV